MGFHCQEEPQLCWFPTCVAAQPSWARSSLVPGLGNSGGGRGLSLSLCRPRTLPALHSLRMQGLPGELEASGPSGLAQALSLLAGRRGPGPGLPGVRLQWGHWKEEMGRGREPHSLGQLCCDSGPFGPPLPLHLLSLIENWGQLTQPPRPPGAPLLRVT